MSWSAYELEASVALLSLGTSGRVSQMLEAAQLLLLAGDELAVARGLAWAARGQRRPLREDWRGMIRDGCRSAVLSVGPISLYLDPTLCVETWQPPATPDLTRRAAALDVLHAVAAAGLVSDLVIANTGDDEDETYLLHLAHRMPRDTWSPLARAVAKCWGSCRT